MKRLLLLCLVLSLAGCKDAALLELQVKPNAPAVPTMAFKITGYTPAPKHVFQNIFVSNFSVRLVRGKLEYSTARDGLWDSLKTQIQSSYGFGLAFPDTNGKGYSDLVLYLAGIPSATQGALSCASLQMQAGANDALSYNDSRAGGAPVFLGLRDCEKALLQLNPALFDNDGDGIPDYLEVRNGLNPLNANDANLSVLADGVSNLQKIQEHLPIDEDAKSQPGQLYAYKYNTEIDLTGVNRTFNVSNISLLNNGADNFIAFYLIEVDPAARQSFLYTAYMIVHHVPDKPEIPVTIPFWGNDPNKNPTNQEFVQP